MTTTTEAYQSRHGWAVVVFGLVLANAAFVGAVACAWWHKERGLAALVGLQSVLCALTVWNVRDDRRQARAVVRVRVPAVEYEVVREEEVERSPCDHDFVDGRCVLCGASSSLA
jgi:hypothetical protein